MKKSLYQFSYNPVQKSFAIELCENENYETRTLLISFETTFQETIWFNMWNTGNGIYQGFIELDESNFKNCFAYVAELIENY